MRIEDIILQMDRRGMLDLRPHLPGNFCERAAELLLDQKGTVLIATGFYILSAERPETDGPPGAVAIGQALERLGWRTLYVTDEHSLDLMRSLTREDSVLLFPIADEEASRRWALQILDQYQPQLLVAIERCGRTQDGRYLNMTGRDISAFTAKLDLLFDHPIRSIGIGDGGNEIGMGNLAQVIAAHPTLPSQPCINQVTQLVIAGVSNWGAYGVLAALSRLAGRNFLPAVEEQCRIIRRLVSLGAVDGITGKAVPGVDGYPLETQREVLSTFHELVSCGAQCLEAAPVAV